MDKPEPRSSELTAIINRQTFENPLGDVTDPADIERWRAFRAAYHEAQALHMGEFPLQLNFKLNPTCLHCIGADR